ncbi:uncharacterized protein LOC127003057 [Eriocheir sinensis]|uniref:uncharacterized protein LOC127003057 n=1 Tax=Eriocheir sinensis TaxID=95602 RepID=UPI0021C7EBCB|nr:uncharacterized protein LOC127003057 [Eriocheir sinensis]XP_050725381.1 uncharacterized protein LOC127003057 [Eriocheir sinensis]XP_050725382.1 uncharacterized protein LOC127003057 [Eriocheir sinensis]XP_050725383.1 uncharacterized protein LOC127003057 [Eriocheir sinensis]XP_050725384.1 uncharacterized protein LOC127003057 [Eriocheir sinensis]XP_050725385.1 uncharacterized protein LOC127003057 [Eriocheir sinensis]XP_050725386.1 uncharacterized protein LOC127003057 [Eriocheir sinensis]XP_0
MPQQHTPSDQVKFLSQWFLSWSEMQREDFLPVLLQAYQPCDNLNGLVGSYEALATRGRRPSLFDCQMKLFHDWFGSWAEADRHTLLEDLRELDPEFMRQYEKRMAGEEAPPEDTSAVTGAGDESQESQNPPSSVSSPPSTLPRSHSPHDSGLDEPTTDSENIDSESQKRGVTEPGGDDAKANTTTITINAGASVNTTTINTTASTPPVPPVKPSNNVTVVEVGGGDAGGGGGDGEGVFSMQDLANGLNADGQGKVSEAEGGPLTPANAPQQECESVSAEH